MSAACLSPERGSAPGDDQRPRGGGAWLGPLVEARGGRGWGRSWLGSGSMPLGPGLTSQLGLFSCRQFRCLRSKASNGPLPSSRPGRADRPGGAGAGLQPAEDGAE